MFHSVIILIVLQAFIQPKSHLRSCTQSAIPPFLLIYLFIHLPTSILRYSSSIAITTETTLIHLSVSLPSHPVVRNLQFILCPLVFPSLLLSVTLLSIHPSMDVLFSSHIPSLQSESAAGYHQLSQLKLCLHLTQTQYNIFRCHPAHHHLWNNKTGSPHALYVNTFTSIFLFHSERK